MVCKMAERKYSCVLFTAKCLFMPGIFVYLSILFILKAHFCSDGGHSAAGTQR